VGGGGQKGEKKKGGGGGDLIVDHKRAARTEASDGAEGGFHGANNNVDVVDVHPRVLRQPAARGAQDTKGHRLLKDEADLVLVFEGDLRVRGEKSE
jgi:hypothetical protein